MNQDNTTPIASPSCNSKRPRFEVGNESVNMNWAPWQFTLVVCGVDIEEKMIALYEKEKKAKTKTSLSYGIIDLNNGKILDILGTSVRSFLEKVMQKFKPKKVISEGVTQFLKNLNVVSN